MSNKLDAFYAALELLSRDIERYNSMVVSTYEENLRRGQTPELPKLKKSPSLKKVLKTADVIAEFIK